MENITHSLLGATLAEVALPPDASAGQRRLFFVAGILAANLPDADLFYTRITPPPLGYLLHHRGHTHTLVGCFVLALGIWVVTRLPAIQRLVAEWPRRFWALIGLALLSHVVADSWNSYGVHPFWPLDNRWYYGDSIFILEPWLWLFLGCAAAANTRNRPVRLVLYVTLIALPLALVFVRMISVGALVALSAGGAGLAWLFRGLDARRRSTTALAMTAAFVVVMLGFNRVVRAAAVVPLQTDMTGELVDLVLNPEPAAPLCWNALAITRNEHGGSYALRRGTIALFAGWLPWSVCKSTPRESATIASGSRSVVAWSAATRQSLLRLRDLAQQDCWVRAWLQFGRAPIIAGDGIADYRFGNADHGNFTWMPFRPPAEAAVCPPRLTSWDLPRADLLSPD